MLDSTLTPIKAMPAPRTFTRGSSLMWCVCVATGGMGGIYRCPRSVPTCWKRGIRGGGASGGRHMAGRLTNSMYRLNLMREYSSTWPPGCPGKFGPVPHRSWVGWPQCGLIGQPPGPTGSGLRPVDFLRCVQARGGTTFGT
jgi:hypothetical protein